MEKNLYTIYDNTTKLYSAPFLDINNGSAMRGIQDLMNRDPNHIWTKFPDNFTLINIGTYDDTKGVPIVDTHVTVAELISIKLPNDLIKGD